MSPEDSDDKQYEPTQKKLDDARRKGDIPRSADLTTAAGYGGLLLVAVSIGGESALRLVDGLAGILARANELSTAGMPATGTLLASVTQAVLPWFAGPALLALLAILGQRGFVFAPSKLELKLSRISPISTAKQKFGRSGLFEFFKSFLKLSIYSVVLGVYLAAQMPRLMQTVSLEPALVVSELGRMTVGLLTIVLAVALALGVMDAVFQKAEHQRKNRMSRKELMDEVKHSEGDPQIKQQRRQRAIEIAMNQMLSDVPDADVVIVNPTHYAVALSWDRGSAGAPVCVAKGVDEIAGRIREVAAENAVPIHSDPPTARALHASVEIGQEIPSELYVPVAAAIRFAETVRKKVRVRS